MNSNQLVSIIIPCYNSEKWINETLSSVFNQTYKNIEIIVVDDGSTDNTKNIIMNYKDKVEYVLHSQNRGPAASRNTGIRRANGKYIAFLDADDLWHEEKLTKQVDVLENNEDIGLIISNVEIINEKGEKQYTVVKKIPTCKEELILHLYLGKIGMNTPTIMVRKNIIDTIGGFDENLLRREDHFFLMKVANICKLHLLDETLSKIRLNSESISRTTKAENLHSLYEPFFKKSHQKFPYLKKYHRRVLSKVNTSQGRKYWRLGERKKSLSHITKALYYNPLNLVNYLFIIILTLGIKKESIDSYKTIIK